MPPLGPNFTRVAVGEDDHHTRKVFIDGQSEADRTNMEIVIEWSLVDAAAARSDAAPLGRLDRFDPNSGAAWTAVSDKGLPEVGDFVLVTGRATMVNGAAPPPVIIWSQTLQVERK